MLSDSSMDCGEAAKDDRIKGFFFTVSFVARAITLSSVTCGSQGIFCRSYPAMAWSELWVTYRDDRTAGFSQDRLRHAAGDDVRNPAAPVRAHDDEVAG